MSHTPGPWRVGDAGATVFGPRTDAPSPRTVARITAKPCASDEDRANARLIAAAPDLLEALERIAGYEYRADRRHTRMVGVEEIETTKCIARAAIRKAVQP